MHPGTHSATDPLFALGSRRSLLGWLAYLLFQERNKLYHRVFISPQAGNRQEERCTFALVGLDHCSQLFPELRGEVSQYTTK
jgi:hypothetical protein